MQSFAELVYSFECPTCKQRVPEGNPALCPHQDGRSVRYDPKRNGPVVNAGKLVKKLQADPVKKAAPVFGSAPVFTSVQDIVDRQCPTGT